MRILVVSDVHGNIDALETVLADAGRWDDVWFLGDLVDYGPEPGEVLDKVREIGPGLVLRGNHDTAAAFSCDCFCSPRLHALSVYTRERLTLPQLSRGDRAWLAGLPFREERSLAGGSVYAVHGSPLSPLHGYLDPRAPPERVRELLLNLPRSEAPPAADLLLVGHTHLQFESVLGGLRTANPGSAGQPRDGDPRAAYMILDTDSLTVELQRVPYDVERVVGRLRSRGVEEPYLSALAALLRLADPEAAAAKLRAV